MEDGSYVLGDTEEKKEEVKICFDSSFFYRQTYSTERDNRSSGR